MSVFAVVIARMPEDPVLAHGRPPEYYMGKNRWSVIPHNAQLLADAVTIDQTLRMMTHDKLYWVTNKPLHGQPVVTKFKAVKLVELT